MDFRVNEDQEALRDGVRSFCEGRIPLEKLPELEEKNAFDRELWNEFAELGVFALRLPEENGGLGLGAAEAVLVFAELGRYLAPGPLVWSHLAAGRIAGAETGETVVGGIDLSRGEAGPHLIEYADNLDVLLVLRPDGVETLDPKTLALQPVGVPLDPLTPLMQVESLPSGERIGDHALLARLQDEGAALVSAMLLGIAEATQTLATAYAKERQQFDRPIGGFQAIKHILSDTFVRQEAARAAVYAAGATLDHPEAGDVLRTVSGAKVIAGEAAMKNSRACIQVHGGMGYTWEVPAHYFLKRTWVLENSFGGVEDHADRVVARIESKL